MDRLRLEDTPMDVAVKMSEGNPGALMAIMLIMREYAEIDPQASGGGLMPMMILDTWKIYGSSIYVLFNDKCNRSVRSFALLQRAVQLGYLPQHRLLELASDESWKINITKKEWADIDTFVCSKLKDFQRIDEE